MATFPSAIPSYLGFTASHTLAADLHASQHNSEQADITAIATKIGTGASTPTTSKLLRGTGTGTSAWAQADLTTDVTGVLPTANGGNGTTSTTGTGSAVFSVAPTLTSGGSWGGSPTLSTPTIADFTNANHNHQNVAGGGILGFGALLSTIFSGQVLSQANTGTAGGTINYINLGGIKLLWCQTAQQSSHNNPSYTIIYPASFFTTVQSVTGTAFNLGVDGNQFPNVADLSYGATTLTIYFNSTTNSVGALMAAGIFVVGA